jgi:hypothetical protein
MFAVLSRLVLAVFTFSLLFNGLFYIKFFVRLVTFYNVQHTVATSGKGSLRPASSYGVAAPVV